MRTRQEIEKKLHEPHYKENKGDGWYDVKLTKEDAILEVLLDIRQILNGSEIKATIPLCKEHNFVKVPDNEGGNEVCKVCGWET